MLSPDEREGINDAIEAAHWAFDSLQNATTLGQQSDAYVRLSNAMSDLVSWHPAWDYERGILMEKI